MSRSRNVSESRMFTAKKMMSLVTPKQLKGLFQKCNGNFMHLVQHRFASHFCELFLHSAGGG
ncbi:hypothetical protein BGX38DRAFT_1197891 [Terfezia claveryi]|nr:hypothetical protein BGX38DRAFT_1197891 [Terfezia claveryi]